MGCTFHNLRPVSDLGGVSLRGTKTFNKNDNNGTIFTISQIIKNVMASTSEAECVALFINVR